MAATPRFIDIHIVQPVPYANLNRDDTNSVKTVLYGDALRTRVSSQSWKRAVREHFQNTLGHRTLRTRRIGERVTETLQSRGWDGELAERAGAHVAAGSSIKWEVAKGPDKQPIKNKVLTNALVYLPEDAVEALADIAEAHKDALTTDFTGKVKKQESVLPKKQIDEILRAKNGIINLFGRMLAEVDEAGVDGAVQVAHAFTTHTTEVELDYFAAVDDVTEAKNDETGSGHMGTAEFSASTFYRFATVDLKELAKNLGDDSALDPEAARELIGQFLLSFIESLPQAKKNSTAPHTLPHLVHVAVRSDRPLSFAAAFEEPVRSAAQGGFVGRSVVGIDAYAKAANTLLGPDRVLHAAHASLEFDKLQHLGERCSSFEALVSAAVAAALAEAPQ
ncbi:type I-E CRISPR-associated protein Cas7/Cse4/CasC [Streptomyces iconiensis]|uniref:Type I-E CRISPR-associated protein Cas7/Cse4/CasC n=1 Tax=Streptomyces iconiensis TaxID=1384038 RepID=A0ABT6ZPX9_9ACTN|nr:type I-E CRISPR-associated protein Cas7/Cse4/CasC [Streptomyces iconiensis]MDJ1130573.1 type I-E CRISPR-associated protein Cas7/Cse4/CasC [Streptomyces iconiensis]